MFQTLVQAERIATRAASKPGDRGAPPRIAQSQAEAGIDEAVVADSCDARNINSPIQLDAERRVSQVADEVRRLAAQPAEAA